MNALGRSGEMHARRRRGGAFSEDAAEGPDLRTHLEALARFWRSVAVVALIGVAAALVLSLTAQPTYQSRTTFFVSATDTTNSALQADEFAQRRINSYVGFINSEQMATIVLEETGLPLQPVEISDMISASVDPETVLLTVTVTDTSTQRTQMVAVALANNLNSAIGKLDSRGTKSNVKIRVISGPTLTPYAVTPRKKLNLAIGLLLGLALGVAQALLRQQLDSTFRSREALEADSGVPSLGVLQYEKGSKATPGVGPALDHSRRAEAFRQLRTSLRFVDAASPIEVLVVTSSVESEGKSTTALNLAMSFAESGKRVLLVDADLRKPKVDAYLDLEGGAGLTTILIGDATAEDVIQPWGDQGLAVLTSGPIPPNPSELLGGAGMEKLLLHLRSSYDLILLDTPPLLPVTDAAVTSTAADGVLLVVRHGKTRVDQVRQAVQVLDAVDARLLGTFFTMVPLTRRDRLPSYYQSS